MKSFFNKLSIVSALILMLSNLNTVNAQAVPVRNDVPRVGQQEVIMMRHAYLEEGQYDYWKQESVNGVWPWFGRLGARIIGDFEVIYPTGDDESPGQDEALRFARYASYEHWQATRRVTTNNPTGGVIVLAGSGGLSAGNDAGLSNRGTVAQGSKEAVFLQGYMAETRPIFMPGTGETFETITGNSTPNTPRPVALMAAQANDEILVLRYRRIKKGAFQELYELGRDGTWPYLEKIGVRPVGQWKIAYLPAGTSVENPDYDEVYSLSRYASLKHYEAIISGAVNLGGDGPDYQAAVRALAQIDELTLESSVRFLQGPLFDSPPVYAPPVQAEYRLVN